MSKFVIQGGAKLEGVLEVNGSKNAALPILAACLIAEGEYVLSNVPDLKDIETMIKMLESFGLQVEKLDKNSYKIVNSGIKNIEAPYELVNAMRASFFVMGPLLAHDREAKIPLPGGCAIGTRPVNYHLDGFEKLGVKINIDHGFVNAKAGELVGTEIKLPFPSVGATENILMLAVRAQGKTVISNVAKEPEVVDLCEFLNKMGAKIEGVGSERLEIEGVSELSPCQYNIIPDRLEAGTFILASALTGGGLEIKNVNLGHLQSFVNKLKEIGVDLEQSKDRIKVKINEILKPVNIKTEPYPGFATDLQPQIMVLLCLAQGTSEIQETIFENRFMAAAELNRLGAKIKVEGQKAIIQGPVELTGAEINATDIRAGAALVLAGLVAKNSTIVNNVKYIDRGHEDLAGRLQKVGARIERVE